MRERVEIIARDLAKSLDDDVVVLVRAERDARVGDIWNGGDQPGQIGVNLADMLIQSGDAVTDLAHGIDLGLALGRFFQAANLARDGIALGFERLNLGQQAAAGSVQLQYLVDWGRVHLAQLERLADHIRLFSDQIDI